MSQKIKKFFILTLFPILIIAIAYQPVWSVELFPTYPTIKNNITFWEHIFGTFTTRQGIVHDKENLSRIYGTVVLKNRQDSDSDEVNRERMKSARKKYRAILEKLANNEKPVTAEEQFIAMLFPGGAAESYRQAISHVRVQVGQKDRFIAGYIRSGAYIDKIKRIFKSYGVPSDLSYLPHIESSFDFKAHSRSGAVGAWQFIRSTGRQFMTINDVIDERYDPFVSAHAAAKFLKQNYEKLGSWPLAITAYNYGQNGMMRALRDEGNFERIIRQYKSKRFQFAAKNYYAEFLASLRIVKKLESDSGILQKKPENTITVILPGYLLISDLLKYVPLSLSSISILNPALRKCVLTGKRHIPKYFPLRLPDEPGMRKIAESLQANIFINEQAGKMTYLVMPGDTAGSIARKFKISFKTLSLINDLNKNAEILSGQCLQIPVREELTGTRNKIVRLNTSLKRIPGG